MERVAELFREGGLVMVAIAALSVLAWFLGVRALLDGVHLRRRFDGRFDPSRSDSPVADLRGEIDRLRGSVKLVGAMASALPLLGLLGTVLGMLVTFVSMSGGASGEPRLLAGGIRQALLTTQAGLVSALVVLLVRAGAECQVLRLAARLEKAERRG